MEDATMWKTAENVKNSKLVVLYKWITKNKTKKVKETTIYPANKRVIRWEPNAYKDAPQFWYGENITN